MGDLLRKMAIYICKPIYNTIPNLYSIFYNLANARFLTDDTIKHLSGNIYVLVSVVMLFVFSATMLSAIVNPDVLSDKKKGMAALVKRSFIGILMIVLIPFAFNEAYDIQAKIMDNALIEKIIVGISYDTNNGQNGKGGNGGQVVAGTLISSVLYPSSDNIEVSDTDLGNEYSTMVTEDISHISYVAKHINDAPAGSSSEEYALEFSGLIAIIAGGATVYILLLFAMDTAVRIFKLAFFELTAPISIIAYISSGDESLKRWATEVGKTYIDVFARIAAMAFYLFMLSHMDDFINGIFGSGSYNASWMFLLRVIVVVGLLIFIKQVPDLINSIFKTNIKNKGGIGGRLGTMAAVGDTAKKAWDTVKKGLKTVAPAAAALAAGPAGWALGAGLVGGGATFRRAWNKGIGGHTPLKDTSVGKGLRNVGTGFKAAGAYLSSGKPLGGIKAAEKVVTESELGKQRAAEREQRRAISRYDSFMNSISGSGAFDEDGKITDSLQARDNILDAIDNNHTLTRQQKVDLKELIQAKSVKATYDKINESKKAISDKLSELYNNTTDNQLKAQLQNLQTNFNLGNLSTADFKANIDRLVSSGKMSKGSANNLAFNLDKINNTIETNGLTDLIADDGKLKVNALANMIAQQESKVSIAQGKYDTIKGASTAIAQELMGNFVSVAERVDKKVTYEQSGTVNHDIDPSTGREKNKYGGSHNMKAEYKADVMLDEQPQQASYGPGTYSQDEMDYYNQTMFGNESSQTTNQNTSNTNNQNNTSNNQTSQNRNSSNQSSTNANTQNNQNTSSNSDNQTESDNENTQSTNDENHSGNGQPRSGFRIREDSSSEGQNDNGE